MRVLKLVVALAAVGLVAGCFPTGPSYEGAPAPSSEPKIVPGRVPNVSYQTDYSFKVEAGYVDQSSEDQVGNDFADVSLVTVALTWYPGEGVTDDETPYALQPYLQRAGYVRALAGSGTFEVDWLTDEHDLSRIGLGFGIFDTDTGLGVKVDQRYDKYHAANPSDGNLSEDHLVASLVWQNEGGFSTELSLVKGQADAYIEDFGSWLHVMRLALMGIPVETPYRGVGIGVRKVFLFGDQALDIAGSAEFGRFEEVDLMGTPSMADQGFDAGADLYTISVTYYPVKMLGIGIAYQSRTFDESMFDAVDSDRFAVGLTATLAERIDITATYRTLEKDLGPGSLPIPDLNELSEFGITVGVRF